MLLVRPVWVKYVMWSRQIWHLSFPIEVKFSFARIQVWGPKVFEDLQDTGKGGRGG